MPITIGRFATPKASKYIQQLCKHFAHKVEVEYTPEMGRAELPVGPALMCADTEWLVIEINVSDPAQLERAHHIIDSHMMKFAFREDFLMMDWDRLET